MGQMVMRGEIASRKVGGWHCMRLIIVQTRVTYRFRNSSVITLLSYLKLNSIILYSLETFVRLSQSYSHCKRFEFRLCNLQIARFLHTFSPAFFLLEKSHKVFVSRQYRVWCHSYEKILGRKSFTFAAYRNAHIVYNCTLETYLETCSSAINKVWVERIGCYFLPRVENFFFW